MDHADFVAAWRDGRVDIQINARRAGDLLSQRLLLPFVAVAVIGLGIGLVLWGSIGIGLTVGACGILVPRLIRRGAAGFLLSQIGDDAGLFEAALRCGALQIATRPGSSGPAAVPATKLGPAA